MHRLVSVKEPVLVFPIRAGAGNVSALRRKGIGKAMDRFRPEHFKLDHSIAFKKGFRTSPRSFLATPP